MDTIGAPDGSAVERDLDGGQVSHEKEEESIGWNVKIEVNEAMHEESGAANCSG